MQWFSAAYPPDKKDLDSLLASPLRADLNQLNDLPKTQGITDEADVLRDVGEAFAAKLCAACNDVTAVRCEGILHGFAMLNAVSRTNAARAAVDQSGRFLHDDLHSGS
ncbi:alpha/beta hydrolase fold domain-containing protein [Streptomyces sp. NPDC086519]|uniref:alpha/beta hydrolase fold domain-containing protein n=1 Tax=Streptomyces sp. NPDC086519 TaxID=3154863 RepID=UPI00344384F6